MSHRNVAGFIEDLNGKSYIGRMSKTLYDKLISYNQSENTIEYQLYRNIIIAIDDLENNKSRMKEPSDLKGILTGYKHAHFSETTEVALINNYALANQQDLGTLKSIDDVIKWITIDTKPEKKQKKYSYSFEKYTTRMKELKATGDWILYIEREGKNIILIPTNIFCVKIITIKLN